MVARLLPFGEVRGLTALLLVVPAAAVTACGSESQPEVYDVAVLPRPELDASFSRTGEGLIQGAQAMEPGLARSADGGPQVPIATLNGPGERVFAARTLRFPAGPQRIVIRQVLPGDLDWTDERQPFVSWKAYAAEVRPGGQRRRLNWLAVPARGLAVRPGATMRLRTVFTIAPRTDGCVGPADRTRRGRRSLLTITGGPAWMVRVAGAESWQWLRLPRDADTGRRAVVRTGPTRPVTFGSAWTCRRPQPAITLAVDPDGAARAGEDGLPVEEPDGY